MPSIQRIGDIEIDEDIGFQQRMWQAERVAWVVFALVLVATFLGLLGRGPLSTAAIGAAGDPLWIEYDRFGRLQASVQLDVHATTAPDAQTVRVWLDQAYLGGMMVEEIAPTPQSVAVASNRLYYTFEVAEPGQPINVRFEFTPTDFGVLEGQVGRNGEEPINFRQVIYP